MAMKVFRVTVEEEFVVVAADEAEATKLAKALPASNDQIVDVFEIDDVDDCDRNDEPDAVSPNADPECRYWLLGEWVDDDEVAAHNRAFARKQLHLGGAK